MLFPPLPATAAPRDALPTTINGVMSYKMHGPTAAVAGFASTILLGPIGTIVMIKNMRRTVSLVMKGMELTKPEMLKNPQVQKIKKYFEEGVPEDVAIQMPVMAHYEAQIAFTLERKQKNVYTLKTGTVSWTHLNQTRLLGQQKGDAEMIDSFSGSGSTTISPPTSAITMTFNTRAKPYTFDFRMDLNHPMQINGTTQWTTYWEKSDIPAFILKYAIQQGDQLIVGDSESMPLIPPITMPVMYIKKGAKAELKGKETFRDVIGTQYLVDYSLMGECEAKIVSPAPKAKLVYNDAKPGILEGVAEAEVTPSIYGDGLEWTFPEIKGSKLTTEPADRRGAKVKFRYEGLPEKNTEFGIKQIRAHFVENGDKCSDPGERQVQVFFPRDAINNPDGRAPNWFYYWKQTKAAVNREGELQYGGVSGTCEPEMINLPDGGLAKAVTYGHYDIYTGIYICDLKETDFRSRNMITKVTSEGIDVFAITVVHEGAHKDNFKRWWPNGRLKAICSREIAAGSNYQYDCDNDDIPDSKEPQEKPKLDPKMFDTYNIGQSDDEYMSYYAERNWKKGSADKEDWAFPGKQSGGK